MTELDPDPPRAHPAPTDTTAALASRVAARAAERFAGEALDRLLAERLPGSDLNTLLLHAFRRRARSRTFAELRDQLARQPLLAPSSADARRMHAFDAAAFAAASKFEAIDLSPVQPLGTAAVVGVDPNNVLAALRAAEVAADPTTALALVAAERRRAAARGAEAPPLRLCTSQRVMRLQPVDHPGFTPHFRLFALATATRSGAARSPDVAERRAVLEHLDVWARLAAALPGAGFRLAGVRVVLSDTRLVAAGFARAGVDAAALARVARAHRPEAGEHAIAESGVVLPRASRELVADVAALGLDEPMQALARGLVDEIALPLRELHPAVDVSFDLARLEGLNYYVGPTLRVFVQVAGGPELSVGDGGALTWLATLLSDRRERWVTSAVGTELLVKLASGSGGGGAGAATSSRPGEAP